MRLVLEGDSTPSRFNLVFVVRTISFKLLYGLVILGIVLVIPRAGLSAVSGFTDAYSAVAGVLHSRALDAAFAVLVILTLAGSGLKERRRRNPLPQTAKSSAGEN